MINRRIALGFLLSIILIYIIIWKPHISAVFAGEESFVEGLIGHPRLDFTGMWSFIKKADPVLLLMSLLIPPIQVAIRAHRWTLLVEPVGKVRLLDSFSLQMVGYFANTVLPLRAGEVIRGVLLGQRANIPRSTALATVVFERLLDILSLLALIALAGIMNMFATESVAGFKDTVGHGATVMGIGAVAVLVLIVYYTLRADPTAGLLGKFFRLLPKVARDRIEGILLRFIHGFSILKSSRSYIAISLETIVLWFLYGLQIYLVMLAFGLESLSEIIGSQPILSSVTILAICSVGLSVPSAPGGVGTFHAACIVSLSLLGITNQESAAGFSVILHAISVSYYIFVGAFFMWREGMRLSELKQYAGKRKNHGD